MNEILVGMSVMLVVLLTFSSGFFVGRGFREKPLLPIEPAKPDRIRQLEYEAEQKALADCLNYSIDVAYKVNDK